MPDSVEAVKIQLLASFPPEIANSPYFEDFARIGSYLSDPNQYRYGLEQLHGDMEVRFYARIDELLVAQPLLKKKGRSWLRQSLPAVYRGLGHNRGNVDRSQLSPEAVALLAFRKILTDALKANEINNGFQVGAENEKIDILVGFPEVVDGKSEFNDFLRQKKLFKDLSAGKEHGENSHRIQWYLISKLGTLAHPAAEIYSKLPPWRTPSTTTRRSYLWEFLVDRDGVPSNASSIPFKAIEQTDFRAPSNLNRCLRAGVVFPQFDLLTAVLVERWDRRDPYMVGDYLVKKLFKREAWKELTSETLELLWAQASPGGELRILKR